MKKEIFSFYKYVLLGLGILILCIFITTYSQDNLEFINVLFGVVFLVFVGAPIISVVLYYAIKKGAAEASNKLDDDFDKMKAYEKIGFQRVGDEFSGNYNEFYVFLYMGLNNDGINSIIIEIPVYPSKQQLDELVKRSPHITYNKEIDNEMVFVLYPTKLEFNRIPSLKDFRKKLDFITFHLNDLNIPSTPPNDSKIT